MGRQAYLARLALGRSAFDAPLRDENGELVLGGLARAFDDSGYVQQWDDRGHPQNEQSVAQARRFRKAQNEVLQACGVIVRRDAENKTEWEGKPLERKLEVIIQDNRNGSILKGFDRDVGVAFSWWATSLRRRIMTFGLGAKSLTAMAIDDVGQVGFIPFLFAGLPALLLASCFKATRYLTRDPEAEEIVNYFDTRDKVPQKSWLYKVADAASQLGYLALEVPIEVVSILQSIYFLNLDQVLSPWFFVHFLRGSPIFLPSTPSAWSLDSLIGYLGQCVQTPLILSLIRDFLQVQVGYRTFALLRQIILKPDRPDLMSASAADASESVPTKSIPGIGRSLGRYTEHRFFGPSAFRAALPVAFPLWGQTIPTLDSEGDVGRYVFQRCAQALGNVADPNSEDALRLVTATIVESLERLGIDIEEEHFIDVDQWVYDFRRHRFDSVTSVDPDDSFVSAEIDQLEIQQGPTYVAPPPLPVNGSQAPTVPANTPAPEGTVVILEDGSEQITVISNTQARDDSEPFTATVPLQNLLQALEDPPPLPPTPEPGLRRATSLAQTTPRPVRRLTEVDSAEVEQTLSSFRDELLLPLRGDRQHRRLPDGPRQDRRHYIVSNFSTFAADSFAWHASAIIMNLALLPVDALYFRAITSWFRSMPSTSENLQSPLGMTAWFGGEQSVQGRFKYTGALLLCLGLESITRGISWQIGTMIAVYFSKYYGWGHGSLKTGNSNEAK